MVEAKTGLAIILLGMILVVVGGIIFYNSLDSNDEIGIIGFFMGYGGGFICALGVIISFIGDEYVKCRRCGARVKDDMYICLNCNTKTLRYYHQKVSCKRCYKKTHYDKLKGICEYCGDPLPKI